MTTSRTNRSFRAPTALKTAALAASLAAVAALGIAPPAGAASAPDAAPERLGMATFVKGTVVRAGAGDPVRGVLVTLRDPVSLDLIASDTTNADGAYRIDGLTSDEYAVKFNGSRRGYETGFLGCARNVVPTWGQACSFAPGALGKARLDKL